MCPTYAICYTSLSRITRTMPYLRSIHYLNILIVLCIILLTKWGGDSFRPLLSQASRENGFYEQATAFLLFALSLWCLFQWLTRRELFNTWEKVIIASLGILAFIGSGEETSWGQQWLKFQSTGFFVEHNLQKETNLHNLINPLVFSTILNVIIYGFFVYLPMAYRLNFSKRLNHFVDQNQLPHVIPSVNCTLIFLFAATQHAWLIPPTYSDTTALFAGLFLMLLFFIQQNQNGEPMPKEQLAHTLTIIATCVICWLSASIFRHQNMQYEIRECISVFAFLYWAVEWMGSKRSCPPCDTKPLYFSS